MRGLRAGGPAAAAAVALIVLATAFHGWPDIGAWPPFGPRMLEVTFLDVGEGDAAVVRTPSGRWLAVDGGNLRLAAAPSPEERAGALAGYLAYRRVRRLHLVVSTHPDADHLHGLVPVVERWPVDLVMTSGVEAADDGARRFEAAAVRRRLPVARPQRGWRARLPDGVRLEFLNPPRGGEAWSENDRGLVLRLAYGDVSFLLAADVEAPAEAAMVGAGGCLASTVLKVPHHGSRTSSTEAFLRAVAPRFAVVSVGPNPYGLPDAEVMERYRAQGVEVLRTDGGGAVRFRTDGRRLWLARGAGPWRRVDTAHAAAGEGAGCRESGELVEVAQP
ncbi:MAG: MBL fold metallo-hydrolase [Firmicutes bacterium]|nr:MBL fold metallo-hydrolase [Bacillota bacterium]